MQKFPFALLLIFSVFCLKGMADTITLKDGTVIEGTITQQDDSQVTISIKVSDSISDERILKRDDITKIDKTSDEDLAFAQLKNLKPDPWAMLSPEAYQADLTRLKAFLDQYPDSAHKADIQAIMTTFTVEQTHQQAGNVKLYGTWVLKKDVAGRSGAIQAQTLYLKMQASAAQGDLIGALNTFTELEAKHIGSRAFPPALASARNCVLALMSDISTANANLKVTDDQWKQGVAITSEPEKSEMIAAHQADITRYNTILASTRMKWPPYIAQSQKSLDALTKLTALEKDRLFAMPLETMNASIAQSDKAAESFAAHDLPGTKAGVDSAIALWDVNEEAIYLDDIIDPTRTGVQQHPAGATPAPGTHTPAPKVAAASPSPAKPKSQATPVGTPVPEAPPKQTLVDFLFTIPGAVTVVICAIGLFLITSFLQKSKRGRMEQEEEDAAAPKS